MGKALKLAVASAIFLLPFACAHGNPAWSSLSYQEAAWLCGSGNLQACDVMYAYDTARSGLPAARPPDQ
jgi:hypothetical protein